MSLTGSILSVDVGIKNLALCVMSADKERVEYIDVLDLRTGPSVRDCLIKELEARKSHFEHVAVTLVEQQMKKNFLVIAAFIEMWVRLTFPGAQVLNYSAKYKLACVKPTGQKWTYSQRKRASINMVGQWMLLHPQTDEFVAKWTALKKKDDAADAICQALSYTPVQAAVINARRPPLARQKPYTRSHIKWLLQNGSEVDDRLRLSIAQFWSDMDECRRQCGIETQH